MLANSLSEENIWQKCKSIAYVFWQAIPAEKTAMLAKLAYLRYHTIL